jgi:acetyl esterase/lipase
MQESDRLRDNAERCAELLEEAATQPERNRYSRMEAAWRALADEQDWLSGRSASVVEDETGAGLPHG